MKSKFCHSTRTLWTNENTFGLRRRRISRPEKYEYWAIGLDCWDTTTLQAYSRRSVERRYYNVDNVNVHCLSRTVQELFTALHCIGDRKSVRPSICPSVKRMNCDKTKETSAKLLTPYKRSIHLVFCNRKNGW